MKRFVAPVLVAVALLTGAAPASAAPADWSVSTTWDLRQWGGVDYGLVLRGPGSDLRAWMDSAEPYTVAGGGLLGVAGKLLPDVAIVLGSAASFATGQFMWCAQAPEAKIYVTVLVTFEEDGRYTFWDRLFGRVKYREVHNWFVTGCDRVR